VSGEGLATPALLLDLDALERNIATMAAHARAAGVGLRPHAKSHKCPEIARRLAAAGALGPACATVGEAEAMAAAGIGGILVTSPLVGAAMLDRLRRLLLRGADLRVVADDPRTLPGLAAAAAAAGRTLPVLVELDVGQARTGCPDPEAGLALARAIAATPGLGFAGVQAYWGNIQQLMPFAARAAEAQARAGRLAALLELLADAGLRAAIVTGGGTGTSFIDPSLGLFTEIQPGSYLFLDSAYGAIPIAADGSPFVPALHVAATVVTAVRPGRVVVNAGFKALATDSGRPVPVRGAPPGATYSFMGDEHGGIDFDPALPGPRPGDRIDLLTSHCDPTVNLHARYVVMRGGEIVDHWPVAGRY
jgi:D-serine deaminase-like pyridoxal phosphate-dependent protein